MSCASKRCAIEGNICDKNIQSCCPGLECSTGINDINICKPKEKLPLNETCTYSTECQTNFCQKPSCDDVKQILPNADCKQLKGKCKLPNGISQPVDFV